MSWQPIETAPKDGTFIYVQYGAKEHDEWLPPLQARYSLEYGGWIDDFVAVLFPQPTHWMPLPDAPPPLDNSKGR